MRRVRLAWIPLLAVVGMGSTPLTGPAAGEEAEALRLLEQGRAAEAAVLLEELARGTAPARLHLALGVARYDAGREDSAEQSWQRALGGGADPEAEGELFLRARFNLARLAFDRAERQSVDGAALGSAIEGLLEARHFLALALRERPGSAPVREALEVISARLEDCERREARAQGRGPPGDGAGRPTGRRREGEAGGEGAADPSGAAVPGQVGGESSGAEGEGEGGGEADGDPQAVFLDFDRSAELLAVLERILAERDAVQREKARAGSAAVERDW